MFITLGFVTVEIINMDDRSVLYKGVESERFEIMSKDLFIIHLNKYNHGARCTSFFRGELTWD